MASSRQGFTFWGTVATVWTALRLKKEYDEYRAVSTEDGANSEGGRIQLPQSARDVETAGAEDDVSLLDTNIRVRRQKKKPAGCCMCCGVDCTLFWKAFGIVIALWTLFGIFKGVKWALTPTPSGLEGMPAFGKDLGCDHASAFYKDSPQGYVMEVASPKGFHDLKIQGAGAGTVTLTTAPSDAQNVSYSIVMSGTDQPLLGLVKMELTESQHGSNLAMMTPTISRADRESGAKCIKFDIVVSIPPTLKQLHILTYSTVQVKFDDSVHLDLERLSIVSMSTDKKSLILPTPNFHASEQMYLETYNGWIVGDVSLDGSAVIDTQRGDGVAHVKIIQGNENKTDKKASLQTATGAGRSEFTYIADKKSKRTIDSRHISARNGDVYLKYEGANFNGKIAMSSRSSTIHGMVTNLKAIGQRVTKREDTTEWTHSRGDVDGSDKLRVESNGWTGLWF